MHRTFRLSLVSLAAIAVGGCMFDAAQVRDADRRTEVASKSPPITAIHCVARKAEASRSGAIASSVRPMRGSEQYEMALWALDNTVAVVEATPAAGGSTLTVFLHPKVLDSAAADLLEKVRGC